MPLSRRSLLLLAAALALPPLAHARPFPANIRRGTMTPGYFPDITIDGQPRQLAAGARIFNRDNMIEMPGALRGSDIAIYYTVDRMGYINQIWILTPEEAAQNPPEPASAVK